MNTLERRLERQKLRNKERDNLLQIIGNRSVTATTLTRELYPEATATGPEYQHIRYRLNQMKLFGYLLSDEPKPSQERRYWNAEAQTKLC